MAFSHVAATFVNMRRSIENTAFRLNIFICCLKIVLRRSYRKSKSWKERSVRKLLKNLSVQLTYLTGVQERQITYCGERDLVGDLRSGAPQTHQPLTVSAWNFKEYWNSSVLSVGRIISLSFRSHPPTGKQRAYSSADCVLGYCSDTPKARMEIINYAFRGYIIFRILAYMSKIMNTSSSCFK